MAYQVTHLVTVKETSRKKATASGSECHWKDYKVINNRLGNLLRNEQKEYLDQSLEDTDNNSKKIWGLLR